MSMLGHHIIVDKYLTNLFHKAICGNWYGTYCMCRERPTFHKQYTICSDTKSLMLFCTYNTVKHPISLVARTISTNKFISSIPDNRKVFTKQCYSPSVSVERNTISMIRTPGLHSYTQIKHVSFQHTGFTHPQTLISVRHNSSSSEQTERLSKSWNHFTGTQTLSRIPTNDCTYHQRRYISKKDYSFPELLESDLEEEFMKGSGPGGQSVATSSNCVQLRHVPTGVQVKVHETRSLEQNRKIARERLREYVDLHINKDTSYLSLKDKDEQHSKQQKRAKTRKKLEQKRLFKEKLANPDD